MKIYMKEIEPHPLMQIHFCFFFQNTRNKFENRKGLKH